MAGSDLQVAGQVPGDEVPQCARRLAQAEQRAQVQGLRVQQRVPHGRREGPAVAVGAHAGALAGVALEAVRVNQSVAL